MNPSAKPNHPLRLAILGMHIESGTFSPLRSNQNDFYTLREDAVMERYPFLNDQCNAHLSESIEWLPTVHFRAMPGGAVTSEAYDIMKSEIITRLVSLSQTNPLDGIYLDIHGAMTVENIDDAELDLLKSIRNTVGINVIISCSQDLHGNVSKELISNLDFITTYRTAPHIDFMETRERAMNALVKILRSGTKPIKAWCGIPVLLSGEMTSTEVEPGNTLWKQIEDPIDNNNIWDLSLWAGYPWADQPRAMASVVACGNDASAVIQAVTTTANNYWNARNNFKFLSPAMTVEDCFTSSKLDSLLNQPPLFLSDAGDNPTAGGAGDTTGVLKHLIAWSKLNPDKTAIFSNIPDAQAVQTAINTGIGNKVTLSVGGKLDHVHSEPLTISGTIRFAGQRENNTRWNCDEAVIDCNGISVILSSKRRPYHQKQDYTGIGLNPLKTDIVIVKIGYLEPELKAMAKNHILLLSNGGVNPDLCSVEYNKIQRPLFPLDQDFKWTPSPILL